MNALTVTGVAIRQDDQGRYCLNDLHKAAGGERKHTPSRFLRNDQTKALIDAIIRKNPEPKFGFSSEQEFVLRNPVESISAGTPTTYVAKQLVYAYAMWISPEFNLIVIETFDAVVRGEINQHENYWFSRRPLWAPIRVRVLTGETYRAIAETLQINRGRVARAVKSMIRVGLLDPARVAMAQCGPAKKAALRYGEGWGQLSLFSMTIDNPI